MAALNWYLTNNSVSVGSDLSETDPGTEAFRSPVSGWVVSVTAAGNYSSYYNDVERAASTFGATAQPDGTLDTTNGDFWTSPSPLTGSFAATDWTIYAAVRANTRAAGQDGRMRARIFKGTNQNGSGATEITSSATNGTTVTDLLTSATQVSTITINPGTFTCTNEYVFIQLAWEITGDATNATADVNLRIGNGSSSGCRVVTSDFTAGSGGGGSVTVSKLTTGPRQYTYTKSSPVETESYKITITDHTGTISDNPLYWPPELKHAIAKCCCDRTTSSSSSSSPTQRTGTLLCCPNKQIPGTLSVNLRNMICHSGNYSVNLIDNATPPTLPPLQTIANYATFGYIRNGWMSDIYEGPSTYLEMLVRYLQPPFSDFCTVLARRWLWTYYVVTVSHACNIELWQFRKQGSENVLINNQCGTIFPQVFSYYEEWLGPGPFELLRTDGFIVGCRQIICDTGLTIRGTMSYGPNPILGITPGILCDLSQSQVIIGGSALFAGSFEPNGRCVGGLPIGPYAEVIIP